MVPPIALSFLMTIRTTIRQRTPMAWRNTLSGLFAPSSERKLRATPAIMFLVSARAVNPPKPVPRYDSSAVMVGKPYAAWKIELSKDGIILVGPLETYVTTGSVQGMLKNATRHGGDGCREQSNDRWQSICALFYTHCGLITMCIRRLLGMPAKKIRAMRLRKKKETVLQLLCQSEVSCQHLVTCTRKRGDYQWGYKPEYPSPVEAAGYYSTKNGPSVGPSIVPTK